MTLNTQDRDRGSFSRQNPESLPAWSPLWLEAKNGLNMVARQEPEQWRESRPQGSWASGPYRCPDDGPGSKLEPPEKLSLERKVCLGSAQGVGVRAGEWVKRASRIDAVEKRNKNICRPTVRVLLTCVMLGEALQQRVLNLLVSSSTDHTPKRAIRLLVYPAH